MRNRVAKKAFTLMELLIVVAILGILASIAGSFFRSYTLRAKTPEAIMGVGKMAEGEIAYWAKNNAFIAAGPTNVPPASTKTVVDFNSSDPNWQPISFGFADAIYYGYQATLVGANVVDCEAFGDLNGDGILSTFRRTVTGYGNGSASATPVIYFDELE